MGSIPVIRDVAKKTDSTRYALPALRFQTCRLLSGNVRNRELTIIQRRILRRLRKKKRSIKRKIYPRKNLNSYIQSQTTRKLLILDVFAAYIIPTLISIVCLYIFGYPLIFFCDSEDGNGDGGDSGEGSKGAGQETRSTSAAGPSSRSMNLNRFPNIRETESNLVENLEAIEKVVDQLHAQASSIHSEAELQAWRRKLQEVEGWIDRVEHTRSELATQAEEAGRERAIEAAALRPDPAEVAELDARLEQQRRLGADLQVRVDQIARDQYERDRARARGF